jgi:hypothetical protein
MLRALPWHIIVAQGEVRPLDSEKCIVTAKGMHTYPYATRNN